MKDLSAQSYDARHNIIVLFMFRHSMLEWQPCIRRYVYACNHNWTPNFTQKSAQRTIKDRLTPSDHTLSFWRMIWLCWRRLCLCVCCSRHCKCLQIDTIYTVLLPWGGWNCGLLNAGRLFKIARITSGFVLWYALHAALKRIRWVNKWFTHAAYKVLNWNPFHYQSKPFSVACACVCVRECDGVREVEVDCEGGWNGRGSLLHDRIKGCAFMLTLFTGGHRKAVSTRRSVVIPTLWTCWMGYGVDNILNIGLCHADYMFLHQIFRSIV